ncbi:MAG: hypothetical protein GY942_20145 [Aestuariibacter sp.]|nr:hypothetical protein [Aestuariibacter sp.]
MTKTTPEIRAQQLFCYSQLTPLCRVESPEWFVWLETATAFRYLSALRRDVYRGQGPLLAPVSFRKEQRRQTQLWYAYRRAYGILHKRYVGNSAALTLQKLEDVTLWLNEV